MNLDVFKKCGDGSLYEKFCRNFFEEREYIKLLKTFDWDLFHYEWLRPSKYFELRKEQLVRYDTEAVQNARNVIRNHKGVLDVTQWLLDRVKCSRHEKKFVVNNLKPMDHPKHICTHENFKYYYGDN